MIAVSGQAEGADFARYIEAPLAWLGENVARHIAQVITDIGNDNVSLVCCGPTAIAPLHPATWKGRVSSTLFVSATSRQRPCAGSAARERRNCGYGISLSSASWASWSSSTSILASQARSGGGS